MKMHRMLTFFSIFALISYIYFLLVVFSDFNQFPNNGDSFRIILFLSYPFFMFLLAILAANINFPRLVFHTISLLMLPLLGFSLFFVFVRPFIVTPYEYLPSLVGLPYLFFTVCWYTYYIRRILRKTIPRTEKQGRKLSRQQIVFKNLLLPAAFSLFLFLIVILTDMTVFRGFLFAKILHGYLIQDSPASPLTDFEYRIKRNPDNSWNFYLRNNTPKFYYFYCYRNGEFFFNLTDELMIKYYATRAKFDFGKEVYEDDDSFFCGTGLAPVLIRPYEKFEWNAENIYEPISTNDYFVLKSQNIETDSIIVTFFLPVYPLTSKHSIHVYSNPIKLDYEGVLSTLWEKLKQFNVLPAQIKTLDSTSTNNIEKTP